MKILNINIMQFCKLYTNDAKFLLTEAVNWRKIRSCDALTSEVIRNLKSDVTSLEPPDAEQTRTDIRSDYSIKEDKTRWPDLIGGPVIYFIIRTGTFRGTTWTFSCSRLAVLEKEQKHSVKACPLFRMKQYILMNCK